MSEVDVMTRYYDPYEFYFYCSECEKWIAKDECLHDSTGRPICPICHTWLRTKPRTKSKKKKETEEEVL